MAYRIATMSQLVKRALRRPEAWKLKPIARPKARAFVAAGGPYKGRVLMLVDGNTAYLRFRDGNRGRYVAVSNSETVWNPTV